MFVILQEESESPKSRSKRPTTASGRTFINFVSAKQRAINSKAANKTKQRGAKLLQVTPFKLYRIPTLKVCLYLPTPSQSPSKV